MAAIWPPTLYGVTGSTIDSYMAFREQMTNVVEFRYKAMVYRIVDGDTVDVLVRYDVGFDQVIDWVQRVRLARIDAPERRRPTYDAGVAATEWLESRIPPGTVIWLVTSKDDSFGRYIAEVYASDDAAVGALSDEMVDAGHAQYRDY